MTDIGVVNSPDTLVNSIYPLDYFTLAGVKQIDQPDKFWWSSNERFAAIDEAGNYLRHNNGGTPTSEILEVDLGRIREINYINFDVIRAPIDIKIEYDDISAPNRTPIWRTIVQNGDLPFEDTTSFDVNSKSAWHNVEFHFTNQLGGIVHARYLRITFTRRDEAWPTATAAPFQWAIFARNLRVGRYISVLTDTVGPLLSQDTPNDLVAVTLPNQTVSQTYEARQQFVIPESQVRVGQMPNLLGFGVLINPTMDSINLPTSGATDTSVQFAWSLYDVTNGAANVKLAGGAIGPVDVTGQTWLDVYLDEKQIIAGDTDVIYELRISSLNPGTCNTLYTHSPNGLSGTGLPGTLTFTNGSPTVTTSVDLTSDLSQNSYIVRTDQPDQPLQVSSVTSTTITLTGAYTGPSETTSASIIYPYSYWNGTAYVQDGTRNLVIRAWADIADEGEDILGNSYRHVIRKSGSTDVLLHSGGYGVATYGVGVYGGVATRSGWMSDPKPTPEAVEALYFDVRQQDSTGKNQYAVLDALHISPRTPGIRMSVYYSREGLNGLPPVTVDEWDNIIWEPIHATYTLRRNEIITFPQPVRAAFMKLEFTGLQPLPYRLPNYPPLPPKVYRRYPTWVESMFTNTQLKAVVEDWFLRNATPVETKVLQELADPVREFEYKQNEFLAQLALGKITDAQVVNSTLVDIADKALIDPTTGDKIYIQTPDQYGSPMLATVDQNAILGKMVVAKYDSTVLSQPTEAQNVQTPGTSIPVVSTTNDRISQSFQSLAQTPMRFHQPCRHIYTIEQATFHKKAYFAGIDKVRFLRTDYTQTYDDKLIVDNLYDDTLLEDNSWTRNGETAITDGSKVYVSYEVGNTVVTDEPVLLTGFTAAELSVPGLVRNVRIHALANGQGVEYFQGQDYQLGYELGPLNERITTIERSNLANRLSVPLLPLVYEDVAVVIGHGVIPSPPTFDQGVVSGKGIVTSTDGPFVPDYGAGTYGGGDYGNLTKTLSDTNTVVGVGKPSGTDTYTP